MSFIFCQWHEPSLFEKDSSKWSHRTHTPSISLFGIAYTIHDSASLYKPLSPSITTLITTTLNFSLSRLHISPTFHFRFSVLFESLSQSPFQMASVEVIQRHSFVVYNFASAGFVHSFITPTCVAVVVLYMVPTCTRWNSTL